MLQIQQNMLAITKQTGNGFQHKLRKAEGRSFIPIFLVHSEHIHLITHLQRSGIHCCIFRVGALIFISIILAQGIVQHVIHRGGTIFCRGIRLDGCRYLCLQILHIHRRQLRLLSGRRLCSRRLDLHLFAGVVFRFGRNLQIHILCAIVLAAEAGVV